MKRLSVWVCALFAAFFYFILPTAFAADASTAQVALMHVATITAESPAQGWYTWKHQSPEYKKAHPWEGANGVWCANSTRLGIPCTEAAWKKVSSGTLFLLPAPEVRVYVPESVTPPEAIALRPTDVPQLLAPDLSLPVVIHQEQAMATAMFSMREQTDKLALVARMHKTLNGVLFLVLAAAILFGLRATYRRDKALQRCHDQEQELLELKKELRLPLHISTPVDVQY